MLKIGVLGAGHLGKIHIRLIKEIPSWNLIGFFDPDPINSQKVAEELGVKAWDSAAALIDACDALDIVTPTINHFELASQAIRKFKHVFVEKPLTHTVAEGKALVLLANEANVKVQVGHVERFNPAFMAARTILEEPMFIETHRLAQFNPRGTDVSVVLDLMIHDIDIVLSLVKANIRRISASGVSVVSETPDIANARIEFDNGAVANLTASRISMKNMRKSRFFRKDAYISVDFLEKSVNIVRMKAVEGPIDDPFAMVIDLGPNKGQKQIWFESPPVDPTNAIKLELETFESAITNNTRPIVPIEDGFKALEVAHKIIEQLNLNANFSAPVLEAE